MSAFHDAIRLTRLNTMRRRSAQAQARAKAAGGCGRPDCVVCQGGKGLGDPLAAVLRALGAEVEVEEPQAPTPSGSKAH